MYYTTIFMGRKVLTVEPKCVRKFVVNGELVNIPKSGMVSFPENTEILVFKILHHVFQQVSMAKNISILHHNSINKQAEMRCEKNNLPYNKTPEMQLAENEVLLCSLDLVEKI